MIIYGKAFIEGGVVEAYIKVEDGVITGISKTLGHGEKVDHDYMRCGHLILPGFIDIHTHMRDFEESYKEDFSTGTMAAAAGGVTVVFDMPNTRPRNNTLAALEWRDDVANSKAYVDYGIIYGVPRDLDDLFGYEERAVAMKVYPDDFAENSLDHMSDVLIYNYAKGIPTIFHAEEPRGYREGRKDLSLEVDWTRYIAEYTSQIGVQTHITHVTCCSVVDEVRELNPRATIDVTPHHIMLSSEDLPPPYGNVRPPLRSRECVECLLRDLVYGRVDMVATDHAPHTWEEKMDGANGFPGLETAFPILSTLRYRGFISVSDIVRLYSYRPAERFGLIDRYGAIREGRYGSLVVVDLNREYRIDPSKFFSKARHSPFKDMEVRGAVVATFVRGEPVYLDGEIVGVKGYGENVRRLL